MADRNWDSTSLLRDLANIAIAFALHSDNRIALL